jgi:hypothetical protein
LASPTQRQCRISNCCTTTDRPRAEGYSQKSTAVHIVAAAVSIMENVRSNVIDHGDHIGDCGFVHDKKEAYLCPRETRLDLGCPGFRGANEVPSPCLKIRCRLSVPHSSRSSFASFTSAPVFSTLPHRSPRPHPTAASIVVASSMPLWSRGPQNEPAGDLREELVILHRRIHAWDSVGPLRNGLRT